MLQHQGHTVEQVAIFPLPLAEGQIPPWLRDPGFSVYDQPGQTGIGGIHQRRGDIILSLTDDYRVLDWITHPPGIPWIRYTVYDGDPLPWPWQPLMGMSATVAASPYTGLVIRNRVPGWDPVVIPHAVDSTWFIPPSLEEKREAQQRLSGQTSGWVVSYVGRGSSRKNPLLFFEMAQRLARDPAMHFIVRMPEYDEGDVDWLEAVDRFGLYGRVTWITSANPMIGVDPSILRDVYWASDMLLHPAASEGFGLPLIEARACGIPAICSDFSAMTDWAGSQELVPPIGYIYQGPYQIRQAVPDTGAMVRKVREWSRNRAKYHAVQSKLAAQIQATAPEVVEAMWVQHWDQLVADAERACRVPTFSAEWWDQKGKGAV